MARKSKKFSGKVTPLFDSTLVQNQAPEGEGSAIPPEDVEGETVHIATTRVSAVSAPVTTAGVAISTAEPRTPPTTAATAFIDEDLTIAQTLIKMKEEKAKEKGVAIKDVEDSHRPIRSITTLQPLPTIDPKDKGDKPMRQDTTLGGANAQTMPETVSKTSYDPPLSEVNTSRRGKDSMEYHDDLMDFVPPTPYASPLSGEEAKIAQDGVITRLKLRVKRLEKKRKARTLQPMKRRLFKGRVETSTDKSLGGSTADQVSTARPEVSTASFPVNVSAATPSTPPTTTTIFGNEDLTIAQTLVKMRKLAQRLHEEELAELDRAQKERQKQEEATSAALAEEFDEIQARIDADHELAKQLAAERAEAIRNKPPTRTQVRNEMITYLKHMVKYTHQKLKHKNFEEVQNFYERENKWIDDFKPIDDDSQHQAESTKKRPRADSEEESSKKQKLEEDNDAEKEELRDSMDVVPRDDVAIDVESLATKYPIVDWKTHILNENMMYYQIIRADGSSKNYKIFSEMLDDFDRQDVIDLHRLVNERYETTSPEGYDLLLWGDLKTLFEPNEEDEIWKNQQDYNLISWRLFDSCGVHVLLMNTGVAIHMMIEKKYPLTQEMLSRMLNRRLEVDYESEMAFELLRFTRSQLQK
ncbi:hypothetical protein Tco_1115474 [Tanacetum coccineum]